jgi:hypothetical protein
MPDTGLEADSTLQLLQQSHLRVDRLLMNLVLSLSGDTLHNPTTLNLDITRLF